MFVRVRAGVRVSRLLLDTEKGVFKEERLGTAALNKYTLTAVLVALATLIVNKACKNLY